jgi:P27 family predicted phage terminase small subunit
MTRGRKPKPAARQIAEGDPRKRGVHKLDAQLKAEPAATKGLPECPQHLPERARQAWAFWAEELEAMDLDRRPDAMMLEGACVNYDRAVEADLIVQREGLITIQRVVTTKGKTIASTTNTKKRHPAIDISMKSWILVQSFCSEFGLSPISRTRLSIGKDAKPEDDLLKLLTQPRHKKKSTVIPSGSETIQ